MPIYEYRCSKCGRVNEVLVLGPGRRPVCESCGSEDLAKMVSAPNAVGVSTGKPGDSGSGDCSGPSCGFGGCCS